MDSRCIVIDGYNVIRNTPSLLAAEAQGLAAARDALVGLVVARYRHTSHRIIVVFDGDGTVQTTQALRCGIGSQVIFTRAGETADDAMVRLAALMRAQGKSVTVASNDWAVRLGGASHGADTATVDDLARRLNAAPRHLEQRARHHAAIRARLDEARDTAPSTHPRKGNGRRAPRHRRGPQSQSPL
jgi:uncharacterized protein